MTFFRKKYNIIKENITTKICYGEPENQRFGEPEV